MCLYGYCRISKKLSSFKGTETKPIKGTYGILIGNFRTRAGNRAGRSEERKMIRKGKMTLEEIADCVSSLSYDELKELEAEVMQLA